MLLTVDFLELNSFPVSAIKLFNSLPQNIRILDTTEFKDVQISVIIIPFYTLWELEPEPLY